MKGNRVDYKSSEVKQVGGSKTIRKVLIKNGKGYKSVTKYHKGKKIYTHKKPIHSEHIDLIKMGKFIPGLFLDCQDCKHANHTRKNKK